MKSNTINQINSPLRGTIHKFNLKKYIIKNWFPILFLLFFGCISIYGFIINFFGVKIDKNYLLLIVILLGVGSCIVWFNIMNKDKTIETFDKGIIYNKSGFRKIIYWSDITELKRKVLDYSVFHIPYYSLDVLTVTTTDNNIITVEHYFDKYQELLETVLNNTYEIMFQKYKKIFKEGNDICLGKYRINQLGIAKRNKTVSWKDIKDTQIINWSYTIHKNDRLISDWGWIPISKITNYHVILPLIDMIRKNEL